MKQIADLLNKRKNLGSYVPVIDSKAIESIFFDILKKQAKNITRADIKEFHFEDRNIFIRTFHPAVASEIWRRRERLGEEINKLLETDVIEDIKVK